MFITGDQLWRYMLPTEQWTDIVADSWFYQLVEIDLQNGGLELIRYRK